MSVCTFFGHADAPVSLCTEIHRVIEKLINNGVTTFYVGNQGRFDSMVRHELAALNVIYPHIRYFVVLAYRPTQEEYYLNDLPTLLPESVLSAPKRFAIDRRNRWMLDQATYVVTFVHRSFGGSAKFKELAERKNKIVVTL